MKNLLINGPNASLSSKVLIIQVTFRAADDHGGARRIFLNSSASVVKKSLCSVYVTKTSPVEALIQLFYLQTDLSILCLLILQQSF